MRSRLLTDHHGTRTFAVALETGDRLMESVSGFSAENEIAAAEFSAIGAMAWAKLACFDWETKSYVDIPVDEQVEIASLTGRITRPEGEQPGGPRQADPHLHVHCILSRLDGSVVAGHVIEAEVRPTAEIFIVDQPAELHRRTDPESTLPRLHPDVE